MKKIFLFATLVLLLSMAVQAQGQVFRSGVRAYAKGMSGVFVFKASQLVSHQQYRDSRYRSPVPPHPQNPLPSQLYGKRKMDPVAPVVVLSSKVVVAIDSLKHVRRKNVIP